MYFTPKLPIVLTTHRLAYLCCQCDASLDMKLALGLVVARNERWRYPLSSPLTKIFTNRESWTPITQQCIKNLKIWSWRKIGLFSKKLSYHKISLKSPQKEAFSLTVQYWPHFLPPILEIFQILGAIQTCPFINQEIPCLLVVSHFKLVLFNGKTFKLPSVNDIYFISW